MNSFVFEPLGNDKEIDTITGDGTFGKFLKTIFSVGLDRNLGV